MFRGFYTAASGMITQQRKAEILTNNLSNMTTPGFKADQSSIRAFPEMLIQHMNKQPITPTKTISLPYLSNVGPLNTGTYIQDVTPNFRQGDVRETGIATDFALKDLTMPLTEEGVSSTVFFTLENPDGGVRYTRNGNFTLDEAGYLTNGSGWYVLDEDGNRIQLGNDSFTLREDGWLEQNGIPVTRLGIGFSENPLNLRKVGEGYFETEDGQGLPSAYEMENVYFSLEQRALEQSNVDATETMTQLLSSYRTFEANQKVIQAYDRSMDKAVNEIGKV
ncbi:flagellar hook-basal body protein [Fervidibacillus halotolerans]|uniref:Flagellar hook-basal body protein n=1 Tax=Fervidibacillus halotolerans TaxID=2980027 RepID=A0A9E8LYY9_9BACI|nr:flagellar hook-basal body protein [Fervidibacillus halotolerans]WAA12154.1 flagellar hook-basal body protein [Fervidibacillus halotolerans]